MARETPADKAGRLLAAGALTVTSVTGETIDARVQGDSAVYRLGYRKGRGWWCSCPRRELGGRGQACSHLLALQKVTARTATQQRRAGAA
jgi:hypothetical protein